MASIEGVSYLSYLGTRGVSEQSASVWCLSIKVLKKAINTEGINVLSDVSPMVMKWVREMVMMTVMLRDVVWVKGRGRVWVMVRGVVR